MKIHTLIASLLVVALSGGCSGVPLREKPDVSPPRNSTGRPMSCLALSGGGLRSGAVSLGAIQGLYAAKELSRFELVSAVSGGGYPVYGLLDRMIRNEIALRDLLTERGRYIADVERNAAFIDSWSIYREIFQSVVEVPLSWVTRSYGSLQPSYIAQIHRSFVGTPLPLFGETTLDQAHDIHLVQGFPVPIFGASVTVGSSPPRDDHSYAFSDFFELSPLRSGAPSVGYFPSLAGAMTLGKAVAISAAAIDTPQSDAQLPALAKALNFGSGSLFHAPTNSGKELNFYLADGGFIENLGLLPLLRHGCTDILVFDNSDDVGMPFMSWRTFAARVAAQEPGWRMSEGHDLRSANGYPMPDRQADRWRLPHHIWDAQLENGARRVHVRLVKLGIDQQSLPAYPEHVRGYALQNWGGAVPGCTEGSRRRCSFPLEASARQSFQPEEFRAYRLLGQWLAQKSLCTQLPSTEQAPVASTCKAQTER